MYPISYFSSILNKFQENNFFFQYKKEILGMNFPVNIITKFKKLFIKKIRY